ncbi:TraR/DksA family transcriptional regulator [Geodermatophilus ruber]|uniref:Transcriptional regulator, TraR/DksA family n=1 Tax=Geodermatophilus ruber TaxID=504800 RepID=A0A1I4E9M0_9ACTN|nr:TraR/DksA family transcriptional regulator [Geodermatophilus ruber]SFL01307.1 transcriptional regulator, TraR/DksA family [Geodermatophilus ruber]
MTTSSIDAHAPLSGGGRWEHFRARLESQRAECVRDRELALADTVQSLPDDVAVSRAASLQRTIQDIDAALARITAGTYGYCMDCGTEIPEERLELRPFVTCCVRCQPRH